MLLRIINCLLVCVCIKQAQKESSHCGGWITASSSKMHACVCGIYIFVFPNVTPKPILFTSEKTIQGNVKEIIFKKGWTTTPHYLILLKHLDKALTIKRYRATTKTTSNGHLMEMKLMFKKKATHQKKIQLIVRSFVSCLDYVWVILYYCCCCFSYVHLLHVSGTQSFFFGGGKCFPSCLWLTVWHDFCDVWN